MRERVQNLQSKIYEVAGEAMLEHKTEIVGLLINQQQEEHVSGDNQPLKPYSRNYRLFKQTVLGQSGDVNYDATGEMQGSMELTVFDGMYEFNSPAQTDGGELKTDRLKMRDGDKAFELTDENKALIYPIIKDTFLEKVNLLLD
jgi:hypothetical protein